MGERTCTNSQTASFAAQYIDTTWVDTQALAAQEPQPTRSCAVTTCDTPLIFFITVYDWFMILAACNPMSVLFHPIAGGGAMSVFREVISAISHILSFISGTKKTNSYEFMLFTTIPVL